MNGLLSLKCCTCRTSSYLGFDCIFSLQADDSEVVNFLLQTEIIPLCLRIMETGSELSKTVATFIVQKILLDEAGLEYICSTAERFYAVSRLVTDPFSVHLLTDFVTFLCSHHVLVWLFLLYLCIR